MVIATNMIPTKIAISLILIQNNDGAWEKGSYKIPNFCVDTPDQIRTGVAGSKVLHD